MREGRKELKSINLLQSLINTNFLVCNFINMKNIQQIIKNPQIISFFKFNYQKQIEILNLAILGENRLQRKGREIFYENISPPLAHTQISFEKLWQLQ